MTPSFDALGLHPEKEDECYRLSFYHKLRRTLFVALWPIVRCHVRRAVNTNGQQGC